MLEDDKNRFAAVMTEAALIFEKTTTKEFLRSYWNALQDVAIEDFEAAMRRIMRTGRWFPRPAEVRDAIAILRPDGRPGLESAWSQCVRLLDERDSVAITTEMREAWRLAWPAITARGDGRLDTVAGRRAFLEAYGAIVERAKAELAPVKWELQIGSDPDLRAREAADAVRLGRLPAEFAALHQAQIPFQSGGMALLAYEMSRALRDGEEAHKLETAIKHLEGLRAALSSKYQGPAARSTAQEKREAFEAAKGDAVSRVMAKLGVDDLPLATLPADTADLLGARHGGSA